MAKLHDKIKIITEKIQKRSSRSRSEYLSQVEKMRKDKDADRGNIGCSNLAHAAASTQLDKLKILKGKIPNIAIISSYNDMLSAHKPFEKFPSLIMITYAYIIIDDYSNAEIIINLLKFGKSRAQVHWVRQSH